MRLAWWIWLVWVPVVFFLKAGENLTAPHELLRNYGGDYTDTDGDGMTGVAESKYGYDALDSQSFPKYDYGASPEVVYPIANSSFNDAVVCKTQTGIRLKWDNKQALELFQVLFDLGVRRPSIVLRRTRMERSNCGLRSFRLERHGSPRGALLRIRSRKR